MNYCHPLDILVPVPSVLGSRRLHKLLLVALKLAGRSHYSWLLRCF